MRPAAFLLGCCFALQAWAQDCTPARWLRLAGGPPEAVSPALLIAELAQRDVVLLGEQHPEADHHHWQLHTLAALHAQRPDMAIGFEMFPRRVQPLLDRWVAGELTAQQFLAGVQWDELWGTPPELYLPLFEFARLQRVRMVALNVDRKLTQAVAEKGWDAVPEREREGVSRPAPAPQPYLDELDLVHREHPDKTPFRYFVEAQQTWDRAMAQALAAESRRPAGAKPLVVGIMGSGHLRHGHGVPLQLRDLGITRLATALPLGARSECADIRAGLADAVFVVPEREGAQPAPPRLGVSLEQQGDAVKIAQVIAGSLAERSGLRAGDIVVAAAGKPLARVARFIETVRRQPEGTWLPVQVRRGAQTHELVIRFPAAP